MWIKKLKWDFLAILIVSLLPIAFVSAENTGKTDKTAAVADLQALIEQLQNQIKELQAQIAELKVQMATVKGKKVSGTFLS